ncbi:MAG: universal stress protein [Pseudomonas sp.]|uniref:universal stress protein n=1 Tax=Pseudomonas sp. TaxID=306 RepID=UPI00339AB2BA
MIKHILIAHDLRSTADLALRRAAQLALQHGARLTLLHVANPQLSTRELEVVQQALETSLSQYAPPDSTLMLLLGRPAEVVLEQLQHLEVDLLVLGAQRQRHPLFPGTTLDGIARHCSIPLLLVTHEDDRPYPSALLALDFSIWACNALSSACHLLPPSAELHALNVFQPDKGHGDLEKALYIQRQLIGKLLHDETQQLPKQGPRLSHAVLPGSMPQTLQEQIEQRAPALLVLGNRCRGALASALQGDLVQHFLHKAPCDVLVVL